MTDRTTVFFECDHLRPLVLDTEGEWRHITHEGGMGSVCGATSVYRMEATVIGYHTLDKYVSYRIQVETS